MIKFDIMLDGGILPKKATEYSACYDLYCPDDVELKVGRQLIDLKFCMALPVNYEADIKGRSGYTLKGIEVSRYHRNGDKLALMEDGYRLDADVELGTVDADYRDHVGVMLKVHRFIYPNEVFILRKGTRFAQMQIHEVPETEINVVNVLDKTIDRGGGYGHTGSR